MIPFTDEHGLRDYRAHVEDHRPITRCPRWLWLVVVGASLALLLGVLR